MNHETQKFESTKKHWTLEQYFWSLIAEYKCTIIFFCNRLSFWTHVFKITKERIVSMESNEKSIPVLVQFRGVLIWNWEVVLAAFIHSSTCIFSQSFADITIPFFDCNIFYWLVTGFRKILRNGPHSRRILRKKSSLSGHLMTPANPSWAQLLLLFWWFF
jgi:hypothetical protein